MTTESVVLVWRVPGPVKLAVMEWRTAVLPAFQLNIGSFRLLQLEPAYVLLPIMIQAAIFANFVRLYVLLAGGLLQIVLHVKTLSTIVL